MKHLQRRCDNESALKCGGVALVRGFRIFGDSTISDQVGQLPEPRHVTEAVARTCRLWEQVKVALAESAPCYSYEIDQAQRGEYFLLDSNLAEVPCRSQAFKADPLFLFATKDCFRGTERFLINPRPGRPSLIDLRNTSVYLGVK